MNFSEMCKFCMAMAAGLLVANNSLAQNTGKPATPAQLEAKRKCPDGQHKRCGELVGPYAEQLFQLTNINGKKVLGKDMPAHERTFGSVRYKIPFRFASTLDPSGKSAQLTAYWVPLRYMSDGTEAMETKLAREAMKLGQNSSYGVNIFIGHKRWTAEKTSTYDQCKTRFIDTDKTPTQTYFDMSMYVDRSAKGKLVTHGQCYVSDDSRYEFYPGVPVTYQLITFGSGRGGTKDIYVQPGIEADFTLHSDTVYVKYRFPIALLHDWKEIHTAVLNLIQSWEQ